MYLMVAGGIMSSMHLLIMLAGKTDCDGDDKLVIAFLPIVALTMLVVGIWGSVVIFGKAKDSPV